MSIIVETETQIKELDRDVSKQYSENGSVKRTKK